MTEKTDLTRVDNPYALAGDQERQGGAMALVESQRAVAEVIASMQVARKFPRDRRMAVDMILNDCSLPVLAEDAVYEFSRGGSDITGASIRLAEVLAQRWGNLQCGVKELSRGQGYSEVMAYAMDLETGFRDEKTFQVRHWRDKKNGRGYELTDERDIYETVANQGARRKRACILAVIPKDVQEAAVRQCEVTLKSKVEINAEFISSLLQSFADNFGVSQEMIEKRIQRRIDALTPGMAVQLRKIANSLRDGMSTVQDWFEVGRPSDASRSEEVENTLARTRREVEQRGAQQQEQKQPEKRDEQPRAEERPAAKPPADKDGEITNATLRSSIASASSQKDLTPLMHDILKLPDTPERRETMQLWNKRVVELKEPAKPVEQAEAPKVAGGKPKGSSTMKKKLLERMARAKKEADLNDVQQDMDSHAWEADEAKELADRLAQCREDLAL